MDFPEPRAQPQSKENRRKHNNKRLQTYSPLPFLTLPYFAIENLDIE